MSTELIKVSATEAIALGKQFHESGMFPDIKSAAQAIVKIQAGAEIGIPPFQAMSGIHIIQGKPIIGAGIMAAAVKGSGKYDYLIKQQDEKACIIEYFQGEKLIGTSTFTKEDAVKAGTKNIDKFIRNMLFARAMSNGVRWFTPDVFSGPVYTPEEMNNIVTEDIPAEITTPDYKPTEAESKELESLINNSTLDASQRIVATNSITNAKTAAEVKAIKTRLLQLQTV